MSKNYLQKFTKYQETSKLTSAVDGSRPNSTSQGEIGAETGNDELDTGLSGEEEEEEGEGEEDEEEEEET